MQLLALVTIPQSFSSFGVINACLLSLLLSRDLKFPKRFKNNFFLEWLMALDIMNNSLLNLPQWLLVVVIAWTLVWKGFALWRAAKLSHKIWLVIILVINTLGILEILYLFLFSKLDLKKYGEKGAGKNGRKRK